MIIFKNWRITSTKDLLAYQYDNLSRSILVRGNMPEGYTWSMLVKVGNDEDIIALTETDGGVGAVLTADQLASSGEYKLQMRGANGEEVRHTNVVEISVGATLFHVVNQE